MIPDDSDARSQNPPGVEIHPGLLSTFGEQFAACFALDGFSRDHRPSSSPTPDAAGRIILWTYARSTKTFRASLRLAAGGYGEQAMMINRSLFEDMAIARWVERHPEEALPQLTRHTKWARERWGKEMEETGLQLSSTEPSELSSGERKELNKEFMGKTWVGLSLPGIIADIRDEWPTPLERQLFEQLVKLIHMLNNTVLHQSAVSLGLAGERNDEGDLGFSVGPSETLINSSLLGALGRSVREAPDRWRGERRCPAGPVAARPLH